ncbi:MAG: homoserine O-acetyltransferase [Woeseiaceae bacterium]|nr:homoserine O-acetyltransferase [Woeseiaceae bacterium]
MATTISDTLPAQLAAHIDPDTRFYRLPEPLRLESGEVLHNAVIAYRTWGNPANAGRRAVLICHALTASADADRWWPDMIGPGGAFDPATDYVICSNLLGSCYGTTGPVSRWPESDVAYRADFPDVTVRDMVHAQRRLLDHLGVERLALVTGPSLGGMQALEWALLYPERVAAIAPIGVGGRHSAWCLAISEAQRAAIAADSRWQGGYYDADDPPLDGLAAARMMAVCSYRSWQSFQQRFGREIRPDGCYQVQSYLRYQGDKLNQRFDANSYVGLTRAMNSHDLARDRGDYFDVLESLRQPALIVSVSSDVLYPPEEQQLLARHLPNARYRVLETDDGHDGFLIKTGPLARMIRAFREESGTESRRAANAA